MWPGGIGSSSIRWCWSFWNNFTGEFRRPGGGFLFRVEKEPKDARGSHKSNVASPHPIRWLPPDPHFTRATIKEIFRYRKGAGGSVDTQLLVFRCRFVVAKSACLRFRLTAKTALASLLLLSNANPLRWALRWGPPSAAYMIRLRGLGTHLFESAFVAVGLKYGSGKRRTRATLRFSRRARCPHRAVLGRPGVPPLRRESKPDSASGTGDREGRPYGFTKAYLKPWRAGEDTRPYGK